MKVKVMGRTKNKKKRGKTRKKEEGRHENEWILKQILIR